MKIQFKTLFVLLAGFLMMMPLANAQLISSNNLGIFPPPGPFNPNGKFTSLGESGGIAGPINGCDLYGFRAQTDTLTAINLGIETFGVSSFPALSFSSAVTPFFIEQRGATGNGNGPTIGCGKILGWYFDSTVFGGQNDIVYQLFGSGGATGFWVSSDKNIKRDISSITDAMDILNEINGVTYEYRADEYPELNLRAGVQYGFLAQDVQAVMPEAVQSMYNRDGEVSHLSVNYDMVIPVLTEALKDQDIIIEEQQNKIESLEERIARLERLIMKENSTIPKIGLRQNRPNPFSGVTSISYDLPANMYGADLVVYDVRGVEIERMRLAPGAGSVDYDAGRLNSGIYFYAVEVDGQNLARQKMVIK